MPIALGKLLEQDLIEFEPHAGIDRIEQVLS